jgi:hypothetical protein
MIDCLPDRLKRDVRRHIAEDHASRFASVRRDLSSLVDSSCGRPPSEATRRTSERAGHRAVHERFRGRGEEFVTHARGLAFGDVKRPARRRIRVIRFFDYSSGVTAFTVINHWARNLDRAHVRFCGDTRGASLAGLLGFNRLHRGKTPEAFSCAVACPWAIGLWLGAFALIDKRLLAEARSFLPGRRVATK